MKKEKSISKLSSFQPLSTNEKGELMGGFSAAASIDSEDGGIKVNAGNCSTTNNCQGEVTILRW